MKHSFTKMSLICALFAFSFISCGDDPITGVNCNSSVEVNQAIGDEVGAISTATQNWIADQSTANCNALETAYQNYIDALSDLQDCANQAGVGAEFMQSLIDAEASIANLNC